MAAPTVSWSDSGDQMGTIVVSANSDQDFFINRALGDPGRTKPEGMRDGRG
jgi:hypothetical protein